MGDRRTTADDLRPPAARFLFAPFEPYYQHLAVAVALVLSAAVTYSAWDFASEAARNEARIRFGSHAGQLADAVRDRLGDYEQVLRGGAGLFAASQSVERHEWRAYVQSLRVEEIYPGLRSVGFAAHVPAGRRAQHERLVRAEGLAGYAIHPGGGRAEQAPIVYLEPHREDNRSALGYDLYAEPASRAAMEAARDSGQPATSGSMPLREAGREKRAAVHLYVPVYRNGEATATLAQRRAAFVGCVFGVIQPDELMRGIADANAPIRMQIFDGESGSGTALLYDSAPRHASPHGAPAHGAAQRLSPGGRSWTLWVSALPAFDAMTDRQTPRLVALTTGAMSALILIIFWLLSTLRARAVRLARAMTLELQESRKRLSLALDGSNLALFDWDVGRGTVHLSKEWSRIVGGDPVPVAIAVEEIESLTHPEEQPMIRQKIADVLGSASDTYVAEHRVRTRSGQWRWISARGRVVARDASGRALRVTGTHADITERKEIERLKNEFIATVSHELRTPLTAIVGALGLLHEEAAGRLPPDAATFLDMAQRNSERLSELINGILDLEKIESGLTEFRADAVAIAPLLERAVDLGVPYAEKFDTRLELARPLPDATVTGDEDRLLQVMANLLSNAAKFSPAGAAVTVSAAVKEGMVRVAVADRGPGVPVEFRDRIFQKFAQADGSNTRKGGSGLGLSISKAIVEKLGGRLGYESIPGQGATFYFELPLRPAAS